MALTTQTFNSTTTWTVPAGVNNINKVLIVSGGGGGGNNNGGGGGGGRVRYEENVAVTPGGTVSVTVGNGGAASANGQSSAFGAYSITGGGAGADNLGSGGSSLGGAGGAPSGTTGGGGASAVSTGKNAGDFPGIGADGYYWDVTDAYYGGGGQGGSPETTVYGVDIPPERSQGGGGAGGGAINSATGEAGTANLGGGGGGARNSGTGGAGGKGVVIIQYNEPEYELSSDINGVAEGETITFTLRTRNVPNGTVINYTLSGTGVSGADFSSGTLSGTFTVTSLDDGANGTATEALTLVNDSTEEGNEVVTLTLVGPGNSTTFVIGDSNIGTISDPESIIIRTTDYNTIQSRLATVLGTGSGNSGWGQTVQSSQVSASSKVSVNDYANLKKDIIGAYRHIYGSDPSLVDASVSTKVRANSLNAPYKQYLTYVNIIEARKFSQPPGSQSITNNHGSQSFTSTWTEYLTSTVLVSFSSGEEARYFFNSGGEIRFTSGRSGGAVNTHNTTWTTLLTTAGSQAFGGAKPTQGTSPDDGTNYHKLTTSYQPWYEANASSPYAENVYKISARLVSAVNPKDIEFKVEWIDDYQAGGTVADEVDGTLTLAVTSLQSSGSLEPVSVGTFDIESPTVSISAISATGGATYNIVPSVTSMLEGQSVTFNISGTDITNGTYDYEIFGVNASDFTDGLLQGTVSISSNTGSFSKTLTADLANEPNEVFYAQLRDSRTTLATSSNVTVYNVNVSPTAGNIKEGESVTFNVSGTSIPSGTYSYAIGGGVTSADFTDNTLSGTFSISSNSGSITKTLATNSDSATETFYLDVKSGSTILARSTSVTVSERSNVDLYGAAAYKFTPDGSEVSNGNASRGAGMPGDYDRNVHGDVIWPNSGSWVGTIITPSTSSVTFQFSCDNFFSLWINNTQIVNNDTDWTSWNIVTKTVIPGSPLYISAQVGNSGGAYGFAGRVYNGGTTFTKTTKASFANGGWRSQ